MTPRGLLSVLLIAVLACHATAFVVVQKVPALPQTRLDMTPTDRFNKVVTAASTMVVTSSAFPLIVKATEAYDDNYEYGAVDAPIGIAVGAGILAILTALLPIALRGGEEAFEEIRERDKESFGSGKSDALNKRKK